MARGYRRILLKLSGEALAGKHEYGIDPDVAQSIAREIKEVYDTGVQIGIVIGGGNIFRGVPGVDRGVDRIMGDSVGMLATLINSLLLCESLVSAGIEARVLSAIRADKAAEYYVPQRAMHHLEQGRIVLIAGGTSNPFFTTDTAAALRCAELQCEILLKATKVDGVYDSDPVINPDAVKLDMITPEEALGRGLRVMDATAFSLCMDNDIPIVVFELMKAGNLRKCVQGEKIGSLIRKGTTT